MKKNNFGFTLVELLTVIFILVSVGTIISAVLVTALRNGTKGNTINDVRQSGEFLISQMSKMITYSSEFCGMSTDGSGSSDSCDSPSAGNTFTTDCITAPSTTYTYIKIKSFDSGQTVFSCTNGTIASNGASMINSSDFAIGTCSFTCSQTNSFSPRILDIKFTLNKSNGGGFVENNTTIPFETSVTLRNN